MPIAVAYDRSGNLYFADAHRHQVFELTLAGTWSVVAGTGEQGFAGDGGSATAALLNGSHGLAIAADGTLYIADTGNQRIRAVSNGTITTVAGSGVRGYSGDGVALQTALREPTALALDGAGNLLVCDTGNQRVRRLSSGEIATIAGNGVQGFSGDGGAGTAAELDTPLGVAAKADGTVLIADGHNQRVRALSPDGKISTFAGSGLRGYAGDGGQAKLASLSLPYGLAVGDDGSLLIADAGNQVIRSVSTQGLISTIAGNAVQGSAADATPGSTAALNSPRAVSVQQQGQPVFAESRGSLVRELAQDNALYTLALLAAPRVSSVTVSPGANTIYGQAVTTVSVSGSAATPQGSVTLLDNGSAAGSAQLAAGRASFGADLLSAGTHVLTATYAGDGLNGSASSRSTSVVIAAAPAIASASPATAVYGTALPVLSGTLTGILPQDAANVHAVFSSTAVPLSSVGAYPITAVLHGQGSVNYQLAMSANSGSLTISPAASATTMSPVTSTYAGLPILLSAAVNSTTSGTPSGLMDFVDGANVVASSQLVNGTASASVLSTAEGAHSYLARYAGDRNFLASTSPASSVSVAAMPDFSIALGSAAQSVQGGSVAVFPVNVSPLGGAFTGAVVMSVAGLPQGATASFSPVGVVPGSAGASVTLSVQTVARTGAIKKREHVQLALAFGTLLALWWLPVGFRRHRRPVLPSLLAAVLAFTVSATLGCGTRTTGNSVSGGQSFPLTVRGTGTNLAGAAVVHSATATLTIY